MNREAFISNVIMAYLDLPDTPAQASIGDFRLAANLADNGVPFEHVALAIKIAFIRRWARDNSSGKLPKIKSFAYFKKVLDGLTEDEFSPDFAIYVDYKFNAIKPDPNAWLDQQKRSIRDRRNTPPKTGANDQIPLFPDDR